MISYEELRDITIAILAGKERTRHDPTQFSHLCYGAAEVLVRRGQYHVDHFNEPKLRNAETELMQEVFWDLFHERIITLGLDSANAQFPFFRVSSNGKKFFQGLEQHFFHDVESYKKLLLSQVPNLDPVVLVYVQEAMQSYRSGCMLAASVMLGVATESVLNSLLDSVSASKDAQKYRSSINEKKILTRATKFHTTFLSDPQPTAHLKEDFATFFSAIISVLRTFRNESGHPTGAVVSREQVFVNLHLFASYTKKTYQLMDYFQALV